MRLRNLTYLLAGLFLVGACETTLEEKGSAQGIGELKAKTYGGQVIKKPRPPKPKGFSITPGSGRDFVVNVGDRVYFNLDQASLDTLRKRYSELVSTAERRMSQGDLNPAA